MLLVLTVIVFGGSLFLIAYQSDIPDSAINERVKQKKIYNLDLGNLENLTKEQIQKQIDQFVYAIKEKNGSLCSIKIFGVMETGGAYLETSITVSGPCCIIKTKGIEIARQIVKDEHKQNSMGAYILNLGDNKC